MKIIKYIKSLFIDTKEGKIKTSSHDWDFIVSYDDPTLVVIKE